MPRLFGIPSGGFPWAEYRSAASGLGSVGPPGSEFANLGACTLSTPRAADRVVLVPDRPGFRMFPGIPSVCGEGLQFETHLGHVFSLFRGLWAAECVQISFFWPRGPCLLLAVAVWRLLLLAWTAVLGGLSASWKHLAEATVAGFSRTGVEELIGALADLAESLGTATRDLDAPRPA